MPWEPSCPKSSKISDVNPPGGHFKPPSSCPLCHPPSNQPDKTRPSQNPSHGPKECVLVGKRILGSRSNNRELWQRPAHSCEAVPSFSTNTARAGTARPCSSPAGPCGSLGTWVGSGIPSSGGFTAQRLRERWRIPGNTAQPSDTPGWAGSCRGKVGPRKGQGWGQRRDRTGPHGAAWRWDRQEGGTESTWRDPGGDSGDGCPCRGGQLELVPQGSL